MRVTVVGSGAIGGLTGAWLAMGGEDVTFVDRNREHVEAIRTSRLRIDGGRTLGWHNFDELQSLIGRLGKSLP